MSLQSAKQQLLQVLSDPDNKVIALSGKWGTGKSYMWQETKQSHNDPSVKAALYISLFGLSSIEQIKLKLIQCASPTITPSATQSSKKGGMHIISSGIKLLESLHDGFAVLNDLGLLLAPSVLSNKLIVIDDIERKHENLNIDEILGFIDEFTKQHGTRFVLVLNSDQLSEREIWNKLHEKVIDHEIRLNTSPREAAGIAINLFPSAYSNSITRAVEACGITNIRVISRIIKTTNSILANHSTLSDAIVSRVIPSTVLLTGIHYRGIDNGPDFNFVLAQGALGWDEFFDQDDDALADKKEASGQWSLLMKDLGIFTTDEYELLVVEYLQSGQLDPSKVRAVIQRYVLETERSNARDKCQKFIANLIWSHNLTEAEVTAEALKIIQNIQLLDPSTVTSFASHIEVMLPKGEELSEKAIADWINHLTSGDGAVNLEGGQQFQKIHEKIQTELAALEAVKHGKTTPLDVCITIHSDKGWGPRQEMAMKSAKAIDFERIIRDSSIDDLKIFMRQMLSFCKDKSAYEQHFGSAMDNFTEACKSIVASGDSHRLASLIKLLFTDSRLQDVLEQSLPADTSHSSERTKHE